MEYTDEQWTSLIEQITFINNTYLKKPLPIILDETGWYPTTEEEAYGKIYVTKTPDTGAKASFDYNGNGRLDYIHIGIRDPPNSQGSVREEGAGALAAPSSVIDNRLAGNKTIFYEYESTNLITIADAKAISMMECFTYEIGGLKERIPIDEILEIQN